MGLHDVKNEHPFRDVPHSRSLRRAQIIVYAPLAVAMAIVALAGFRLGLSIYRHSDAEINDGAVAFGISVALVAGVSIVSVMSAYPNKEVSKWLLACVFSLILGLTLGSWP